MLARTTNSYNFEPLPLASCALSFHPVIRLAGQEQRQYRRHAERLVILRALTAMRASRELRQARAKEVERRFRCVPRIAKGLKAKQTDLT